MPLCTPLTGLPEGGHSLGRVGHAWLGQQPPCVPDTASGDCQARGGGAAGRPMGVKRWGWDFPEGPVVRTQRSQCGNGRGSIPGWGTKIPNGTARLKKRERERGTKVEEGRE